MLCEWNFLVLYNRANEGLNPCSNGRCSASGFFLIQKIGDSGCLNPCSNGRCSARRMSEVVYFSEDDVLILVLMEDALREFLRNLLADTMLS